MISRAFASITGAILFIYGTIAALSPLPLGVPLMVLGFLMIVGANPAARPLLRNMRKRWPLFDGLVRQIGKRSQDRFDELLDATEPSQTAPGGEDEETKKPNGNRQ